MKDLVENTVLNKAELDFPLAASAECEATADEDDAAMQTYKDPAKVAANSNTIAASTQSVSDPVGPTGPDQFEASHSANASVAQELSTPIPVRSQNTYIPDGYAMFPDGLYEFPTDENSDPVFICTPIRVDATFADHNGKGWGRLISVKSACEKWHEIPVVNADLQLRTGDVLATLVDHGLELAPDKKSRDRLITFLKVSKPNQHLQVVKRLGWVDDDYTSFALGSDMIGREDVLPLAPKSGIGMALSSRGTLQHWKADIGVKCSDNPLMILAVSLAFTGPLLAPLGLPGGGLHFRGASSSGKTTLLNLAASVWGGRKLITQWRATSNGLEAIAETMNDMLLPLDEIAEISARDLHASIYMLANGTGKARMTKNVTLADQARWRLALISSGEISVEEKLKEARLSAMAGHEVRLIDIEADSRLYGVFDQFHDAPNASAFSESLQHATQNQHGAVGQAFVCRLIDYFKKVPPRKLDQLTDKLVATWLPKLPSAPDGQILRVAKRFALIGLAGSLATQFGLTGWAVGEAFGAAEHAFLDWYDRRYSNKRDAVERYVKSLQDFLTLNLDTLPEVGEADANVSNPIGWKDPSRIYLPSETWSSIFPATEGTSAAKALMDMQLLLPGEDSRHTRKAPRSIPGRPRLYTLSIDRVQSYKAD